MVFPAFPAFWNAVSMLLLALATSIDALAVGITFALLPDVNVPLAVCLIGATTFVCSAAGLKVGNLKLSRRQ